MSQSLSLFVAFAVLVVGFVLLIKGADAFVDGSSAVARRLRVPPIIIGLTIVSMGTSLPELAVSVTAAMAGNNEIAVSNVTGSNIFNLMVVLGVSALFTPLAVQRESLTREFPFSVACAALMAYLGAHGEAVKEGIGSIDRGDGLVLLALFILFLGYTVRSALKARAESDDDGDTAGILSPGKSLLFILIGLTAIKFGGDLVVGGDTVITGEKISYGAVAIARFLGMSDNLIGLTVIALGTSLPELVTSVVAARKNELDMAVGNVIGSNLFNILFILGTAAAISPVDFTGENLIDTCILLGFSLIVWLFTWTSRALVRWEGVVMLALYGGFLAYIIGRVYGF
ncbi:MAG: calcium/sodium antiporter [Schwartzia sp.]|nr:calcium/sodium antiporter [Schwartzia sp. (in: firmicutes)]